MGEGMIADDIGWQEAELGCSGLPDDRLRRRLRRLFEQFSSAPGQPVPAACGDWAATKAAYRFFDNPRVTEHGVLAGHFAATATRCAASDGPILLLQDTTEFIYSRARPEKIGYTNPINAGHYKAGHPTPLRAMVADTRWRAGSGLFRAVPERGGDRRVRREAAPTGPTRRIG